ncbi:MAG: hypothetical protein ABJ242_13595 [Marinomonas sp.]
MQFDMSKTWDRAVQLFSSNFQILAIIAGVFLLLPSIIMYIAVPELANLEAIMDPGGDPEKMMARLGEFYGSFAGWGLLTSAASFIGYSAMVALIGENGITVGEAIMRGLKSIPTLIAVMILFFIAYMVAALVLFIPVGILAAVSEALAAVLSVVAVIGILVMMVYLMARFSVTMPVIMLEKTYNPVTAMLRSWRLTGPRHWALMGFWLLLMVAYMVIALLVGGAIAAIAALASGSTGALIMGVMSGILGALVAMLISAIAVAIYQQLAGSTPEAVSETFT